VVIMAAPKRILLRSYQVGFGDCYLLGFDYGGAEAPSVRWLLVDFGSTELSKLDGKARTPTSKAFREYMTAVATDIQTKCGGQLHAVVATHRHADHINGFSTDPNGQGPGTIIAACRPKFVVQPWTEDPDLAVDATGPVTATAAGAQGFSNLLANMQLTAAAAARETQHLALGERVRGVAEMRFIGEDNIANLSAVNNLIGMSKRPESKPRYLHAGKSAALSLPGVKVHVLGPPTIQQSEKIRSQRSSDEVQFWMLMGATSARFAAAAARPGAGRGTVKGADVPPEMRWIREQILGARAETLLPIVRALDKAMNNTSLILVFETKEAVLLFPGDAQIENWEFALSQKKYADLVARTTLYKVGHHGSRNATPKAGLWDHFTNRTKAEQKKLWSVMSSMGGKHGTTEATAVPRATLVSALREETAFFTTQDLRSSTGKVTFRDFEIDPATGTVTRV
jgi:hypothetical protein